MQWWEIFVPNKPLSRRSRSPRPPLLPQIQRDLGCNSVLPRINCSEWILHLASSASRGGFASEGTCHRNDDTCLCARYYDRGVVEVTEVFDHGYYRISGSRYNKIKRLTGRARGWWRKIVINLQGEQFSQMSFIHHRLGFWGTFLRQRARLVAWGGVAPPRLQ